MMQDAPPSSGLCARPYRAIRHAAAKVLRIPLEPATIPAESGELIDSFHPAPGWIRLRQIRVFVAAGLGVLGLVVTMIVLHLIEPQSHRELSEESNFWMWSFLPFDPTLELIGFAILIVATSVKLVTIRLQYDCTWYVLTTRAMRIRRGLWVINETTITYANIQNVSVKQGPVERLFKLSNIEVETAGGGGASGGSKDSGHHSSHSGRIEGILDPEALRGRIMDQIRATRTAGLGDDERREETPVRPVEAGAGEVDLGRMAEVLREIREGLRPAQG